MKCSSISRTLLLGLLADGIFAIPYAALSANTSAPATTAKETLTYTATSTVQAVTTVTTNKLVLVPYTFTRFPTLSYGSPIYTGTVTTTYSPSVTVTATVGANSTVSVPTVPGFLPILSESYYTDDILIETATVTTTSTFVADPSPTTLSQGSIVYGYAGSVFTGYYTTDYVVSTTSTVTIVETSTPAVYTSYAACEPNNLASRIPTSQLINSVGEYTSGGFTFAATSTAQECCSICQATPGCFGGGWETSPYFGSCYIYTVAASGENSTCDPGIEGGLFETYAGAEGYTDGVNAGEYVLVAFNGPCGKLDWEFDGAVYVGGIGD